MFERIGFGIYQSSVNMRSVGRVSVFVLQWCRWRVCWELGPGSRRVGWCYVCVNSESGLFM